jgi:hypothetical protein
MKVDFVLEWDITMKEFKVLFTESVSPDLFYSIAYNITKPQVYFFFFVLCGLYVS